MGCKWVIGDGNLASLCNDRWLSSESLAKVCHQYCINEEVKTSSIINSGSWNIPSHFPLETIEHLQLVATFLFLSPPVQICCIVQMLQAVISPLLLRGIWLEVRVIGSMGLNSFRTRFYSQPHHVSLPASFSGETSTDKTGHINRFPVVASRCCLCWNHEESGSHLFFHCFFSQKVWSRVAAVAYVRLIPISTGSLSTYLCSECNRLGQQAVASIMLLICQVIWRICNSSIFDRKIPSLKLAQAWI